MAQFHHFGDTRQTAEHSGFFRWFTLEAVGEESPSPTRRTTHYRPEGPAFRALTEVVVTRDASDTLAGLELRLARSFMEHPRDGAFARDIAKSLLRDGLTAEDAGQLGSLINEIEFPREGTIPVLTARSVEVALPNDPTPGYLVFLGRRGRYETRLRQKSLILENYVRDEAPWFRMALAVG